MKRSGQLICALMTLALAAIAWGCGARPAGQAAPVAAQAHGAREVSFKTLDGWTIVGDLYMPQGAARGAVVLLHQRGGRGSDWVPLCQALQRAGILALAIDQRGAGRSTEGPGPVGEDAPWSTGSDIAAALQSDALKGRGPIGLAGASYGANNALIYAAAHPGQIHGVALFSPGADYHGLKAIPAAKAYRGAVVIFHDRGDGIAGDGPRLINASLAGKDHKLHLLGGSEHGTGLLEPEVISDTVRFFQRILK